MISLYEEGISHHQDMDTRILHYNFKQMNVLVRHQTGHLGWVWYFHIVYFNDTVKTERYFLMPKVSYPRTTRLTLLSSDYKQTIDVSQKKKEMLEGQIQKFCRKG